MSDTPDVPEPARTITSEGLSGKAVAFTFGAGLAMIGAGGTAIFLEKGQAGATALVLFGGFFLVVALMKRIPLKVAIGGATLDASYKVDEAFDVGREGGVLQGYEEALELAKEADESGRDPVESIKSRAAQLVPQSEHPTTATTEAERTSASIPAGYRGPIACFAARITYRQLDYWARTQLIEPSIRNRGQRLYSRDDVVRLRATKSLLDIGVSLQQIRDLVNWLKEPLIAGGWPNLVGYDGRTIYSGQIPDALFGALGSETSVFVLNLRATWEEVDRTLADMPGQQELPMFNAE